MKHIILFSLLFFSFLGQAQRSNDSAPKDTELKASSELTQNIEPSYVTIKLKNGSVLEGEFINYTSNGGIVVRINGKDLLIPEEKIRKFVMKKSSGRSIFTPIRTKKIYYRTSMATLGNDNGTGMSMNISALYQFNSHLSAGIGFGVDNYYFNEAHNVFPVFAEIKTFVVDKKSSPFVSLKTGYSFNSPHKDSGQVTARGGILINPTFGYRFGSEGILFDIYGGYRFQSAYYEKISRWGFSQQDIIWKRIELGVAFSF